MCTITRPDVLLYNLGYSQYRSVSHPGTGYILLEETEPDIHRSPDYLLLRLDDTSSIGYAFLPYNVFTHVKELIEHNSPYEYLNAIDWHPVTLPVEQVERNSSQLITINNIDYKIINFSTVNTVDNTISNLGLSSCSSILTL